MLTLRPRPSNQSQHPSKLLQRSEVGKLLGPFFPDGTGFPVVGGVICNDPGLALRPFR